MGRAREALEARSPRGPSKTDLKAMSLSPRGRCKRALRPPAPGPCTTHKPTPRAGCT